ncbi:MAG TPA: glycosyltransferase [Pyrinomonadaceae bacterium]|jgi:GT2 family glycosyltransferase|nr:glycosyltransferase [Pyrinomonadaceae bacterium]
MSQETPFFSIIIPTYKRPAQLASCLEAVARLDYPPERFEVVIVDDGSHAPPEKLVASFRPRLDIRLLTQRHAGPAAARNYGAARARGDFLAFTDDDCMPDGDWLRALGARFRLAPERLIGGRSLNALAHNIYSAASQSIIDVVYEHFNEKGDALFFASNNFAVPARGFHAIGGFDEKFITSEDRDLCDRWLHHGYKMEYAPEALIYHAHALTLDALWRQHFGYGRGAFRFHSARRRRGAERFKPDRGFYLKLLRRPFSTENGSRAFALTSLILWTQLASAAGFAYEMIRRREMF